MMKERVLFYKTWVMGLIVVMGFAVSACDDENVIEDDPIVNPGESVTIPTEDQMAEKCKIPVVILGEGFSDVAEAVIRRVENPQRELTENAKVILFKGSDIYGFTAEQCRIIGKAYNNGAIIAVDHPKEKQIVDLAIKITAPEFGQGFSGEEHDVPFADFMAYNTPRGKQYILYNIFDDDPMTYQYREMEIEISEDSDSDSIPTGEDDQRWETRTTEEFELSPYTIGLYADEICKWLNGLDEKDNARLDYLKATRSSRIENLAEVQQVTRTYSYIPDIPDETPRTKKDLKRSVIPITVNYDIYGVYSYSNMADCYLIDQKITINNKTAWRGSDGREKGLVLNQVTYDSHLIDYNWNIVTRDKGCYLLDPQPKTTTGSETIDINGNFGLSGKVAFANPPFETTDNGIWWDISHSTPLPDVSVENKSMNNPDIKNNPCWTYSVKYNHASQGLLKTPVFGSTPRVAQSAFRTYNTWIWQVNNPDSKDHGPIGQFRIVSTLEVWYLVERFTEISRIKYKSAFWNVGQRFYDTLIMDYPDRSLTDVNRYKPL